MGGRSSMAATRRGGPMAGDGIHVEPEDLTTHAHHVERIAGELTTAKQAGEATEPGIDAYGKLCLSVPVLLGELQGMVVDGMAAAAESVHGTADRLRETAASYRRNEELTAARLDGIRRGL
ncbi:type VII secretion target [Micromonospora sp. NPDC049282]|uniref:type VII secretion target n=1 Tax=Micromonospora sp. NPDC049282 TaxID=3364269 RepID=UPI0037148F84